MTCSPARLLANQRNAQRSTGPRTPEGKSRSRANAVKHGLTGEGVALPTEDAAEVDRVFSAMKREMRPKGELAEYFARRVATMTVRVERCVRQETAILSTKVRHAEADFDDQRAAEVEEAIRNLADDPANFRRKLLRSPEGVDRLIQAWVGIKEDLGRPDPLFPTAVHMRTAENLTGRSAGDLPISRVKVLFEALCGNFRFLEGQEATDLDPSARRARARVQVFELIDGEIAKLRAHRETFDLDEIARERAEAVDRVLFDPSKEATLARKYEATAERNLYKALDELREVNAEAEENGVEEGAEVAEITEPEEFEDTEPRVLYNAVGSFFPAIMAPPKKAPDQASRVVGSGPPGSNPTT